MVLLNIEHHSGAPVVKVNHFKKRTHLFLNGLYTSPGLWEVLYEKSHQTLDRLFLFVSAFIGRANGMKESSRMIRVHLMFFELLLCGKKRERERERSDEGKCQICGGICFCS